eukprot:CFRG6468T1
MFSLLTERYEENDCLVSGFAVGLACACSIMILPSVLLGSESTIITDTNRTLLLATATCATTNAIVYTSIWGSPAVEKAHNASRSLLSQLLDGLFFVICGTSQSFMYGPSLEKCPGNVSVCWTSRGTRRSLVRCHRCAA